MAQSPKPGKQIDPALPTNFEAALTELESIVNGMETGQMSLEESLAAYKRGAQLLEFCQAALADAQQQVKILDANILKNFSGADDSE